MLQIDPEQVVLAETPAKICKHLHNKHCYAVGQDNYLEIAREYARVTYSTSAMTMRRELMNSLSVHRSLERA